MTLSTAESELIEAVNGAVLGLSCCGLISELLGVTPKIIIHLDNQSALALIHGQAGSWRTRHLRLRVHWLKERVTSGEIQVIYEPGITQRADLGTKPFTRERLRQLVQQWGTRDARPMTKALTSAPAASIKQESSSRSDAVCLEDIFDEESGAPSSSPLRSNARLKLWMSKLAMLCQMCGSKAQEENGIEPTFPREFYALVLVIAIIAIGLWEMGRSRYTARLARLQLLRDQAGAELGGRRLSRDELDEFQQLLRIDPGSLSMNQAERLLELRTRFGAGRTPRRAAPRPTLHEPAASSSSRAPTSSSRLTAEIGVQTAPPAFELMDAPAETRIEIHERIPEEPYLRPGPTSCASDPGLLGFAKRRNGKGGNHVPVLFAQ